MKRITTGLLWLLGMSLAGCTSYVRTFDANDKQLGACTATNYLFSRGAARCEGRANGEVGNQK